ncbi:cytochrome b561 and DOMON domain-containing protein [Senna tora]|uniref:Cytochrome b561 and DOMON domain-containing protein n=1 Tax=Senna tora TaxID=362788 RepID=A0A834TEV3_9FABA|nr:cytochrome b561 and DOMON domain-containing protein [Senna tora]
MEKPVEDGKTNNSIVHTQQQHNGKCSNFQYILVLPFLLGLKAKAAKIPGREQFQCIHEFEIDSSIHWNYHSVSNSIDVAFKKSNANPNAWIAWAINPTSTGMVGSQAFVAFRKSDGAITAYTSPVNSYGTRLEEGKLSFQVDALSATFQKDAIILFATFRLPENSSRVNHVWQEGSVSDDVPLIHALSASNVKSFGQLDFLSGKVSDHAASHNSRILIGKVHGILNGIGWGILMPIGVMLARYLKAFDNASPMWFHLHRALQILAYFIGTAGFGLGIYMRNYSHVHGYTGITIFSLATVQIFLAVFLRPNKDHNNRIFWNIFHYMVGYGIIGLSIFNMFKGFSIHNSFKMWRNVYFGLMVCLGCIIVILEAVTWVLVCKRKMKNMEVEDSEKASDVSQQDKEIPQMRDIKIQEVAG